MSENDDGKASGRIDLTPPNDGIPDSQPENSERKISRRESAVKADEAKLVNREKKVSEREHAADLREHEQAARSTDAVQTMSDNHLTMLRQANENLVIATIEAQKKAEQIQRAKDRLDYLAHHDALTNLPNRTLLQDRLKQAIELAHRQGKLLAVMFMDLDRFKNINDTLGHSVGDQLLLSVAQRLSGCVRHSDTISRQGGDEFVLLLTSIEQPEDAGLFAQKMLAALALPHHIDQHELHVSVSIGISIYPSDGEDAETLIKSADTAMYYAKENGRNNYKFFAQNMRASAVQRQSIEASLRQALQRDEFILYFQPKVDLRSNRIVGIEALVRWQHPELGLLVPEQFIYIAEDCGLILPIDRWVQHKACAQAKKWQQQGMQPVPVAVNISALEFRDKDFLNRIRTILNETGLDPSCLELELTEGALIRDSDSTESVLHALANLGVKLAIDDFGTGYFSLSYLKKLPIDTLKIDQSFIGTMLKNTDDAHIVNAAIKMAKSLNKKVIAEGVETPDQAAFLQNQECDEGQGYYFSGPIVEKELIGLLQAGKTFTAPDRIYNCY